MLEPHTRGSSLMFTTALRLKQSATYVDGPLAVERIRKAERMSQWCIGHAGLAASFPRQLQGESQPSQQAWARFASSCCFTLAAKNGPHIQASHAPVIHNPTSHLPASHRGAFAKCMLHASMCVTFAMQHESGLRAKMFVKEGRNRSECLVVSRVTGVSLRRAAAKSK